MGKLAWPLLQNGQRRATYKAPSHGTALEWTATVTSRCHALLFSVILVFYLQQTPSINPLFSLTLHHYFFTHVFNIHRNGSPSCCKNNSCPQKGAPPCELFAPDYCKDPRNYQCWPVHGVPPCCRALGGKNCPDKKPNKCSS